MADCGARAAGCDAGDRIFAQHVARPVSTHQVAAFRLGLNEAGFVEGQNVAIEFHYADNQTDRLPALAADLIRRPVAVIFGDPTPALAAKSATATVPIVFSGGVDPVQHGLVASLNRPGGNVTGVSFFGGVLGAKRLELLRQLVPKAATIAVLVNPSTPTTEAEREDVQAAAQAIGQRLLIPNATSNRDVEPAFTTIVQQGAGALLVGAGPFLTSRRELIVVLRASRSQPVFDFQRFANNKKAVENYCKKRGGETLMSAIQNTAR